MNKKLLALLLIVIFVSGFILYFKDNISNTERGYNREYESISILKNLKTMPDRQIATIKIGEKELRVEVVNSANSRNQGLSTRDEIGSDGMLFVFPQKLHQSFWMKDMRFNLDFIWISEGRVVEIMRNVPMPEKGQTLEELPRFIPEVPVEMMLEVVAGDADEWGVEVGDEISII